MTSGIYALTFPDQTQYVGKSTNIARRWQDHKKNMQEGKAAKRLQAAYNHWGLPQLVILFLVHPDHLDIIEQYIIAKHRPALNTTISSRVSTHEFNSLFEDPNLLKLSTCEHIKQLASSREVEASLAARVEQLELEVQELLAGVMPAKYLQELSQAKWEANRAQTQLDKYKALPWYTRIFL